MKSFASENSGSYIIQIFTRDPREISSNEEHTRFSLVTSSELHLNHTWQDAARGLSTSVHVRTKERESFRAT